MNSLIQLKGKLNGKKNLSTPGQPALSANQSVDVTQLEKLKRDLETMSDVWKDKTLINGALISAYYSRIVPKSRRIKTLLSFRSELSNESIVGARFNNTSDKHIITYYIKHETINIGISKLEKAITILKNYFNNVIDTKQLEKIDDFKHDIEREGLSKSLFCNIIVDSSNVEKFEILDNSDAIGEGHIISLYDISSNSSLENIMQLIEINETDYEILDKTTKTIVRFKTKKALNEFKNNVPYLISMGVSDMSDVKYEDIVEFADNNQTFSIPNPNNEPVIGVIDTLFDDRVYFNKWVNSTDFLDKNIPRNDTDKNHGTQVCSIVVDGASMNPEYDDGCGRFRVKHFAVTVQGVNSSMSIIKSIKRAVEENPDIRVWNLSLGAESEINSNFISLESALLDQLQYEKNVIFVIAGTNKTTRNQIKIGAPADSINSIVVNALDFAGNIASYSRKGKVLSFFNKPDICYYGGDNNDGFITCTANGMKLGVGTSFAAPWVARKLSYLIDKLGLTREVAKALLIDSATQWGKIDDTISDYIGFGCIPKRIEDVINSSNDEIKFYIQGISNNYDTYTHNIPIPLNKDKYPFIAKATLCYFPRCSRNQGVDYTNTELDIYFGRIDDNGAIKSINENKQSEGEGTGTTEQVAREYYRKWDNVKHINQLLKTRNQPKKKYSNPLWALSIKAKERLSESDGQGIKFGVVITLKEINGINRIDDFINQCSLRGWIVQRIDVENRIDIYNIAHEEIEFE